MANRRTTAIQPEVTDAALVERYQRTGEPEVLDAIIARYRRFARSRARGYFLIGGDADDVEQEALIGLYKAVRDFRPEHQASFRAFAELCIRRQIITAIKTATRQKHQPLNQYQSISGGRTFDEAPDAAIEEILVSAADVDPCDCLVADERLAWVQSSLDRLLSGLEVDVLRLYVEGKTYQEISDQLGRHTKSIDNALQRIKRKLDGQLAEPVLVAS